MAELIEFGRQRAVARGAGIASVRLTPSPLAGQAFVMGVTTFPPGTSIPLHSHNTIEQVTVLEGEGLAVLDGVERRAVPYDTTQIAPGEVHRFINPGPDRLRILWVYGGTRVTRTFAATGETVEQFGPPT